MDTVAIKIQGARKLKISDTARTWFLPELNRRHFQQLSQSEKKSTQLYLRHFIFKPPVVSGYLPKIEMFETLNEKHDDVCYVLKMTFSIPKLLYGNSLQEVSWLDFERVLYALKKSLADAGIDIESNTLAKSLVSEAHFCKNVLLPLEIRMHEILTELARLDISKVVDITKKEYKHGGQLLHIYSGTVERVFYDKVCDAMRPKVKRKDKGRMGRERNIIEQYHLEKREVFRYEYRLKKGQTVKREVNAALGREPMTSVVFKDLFTHDLCKMILLNSWRGLIQRPENQLALIGLTDDLGLLLHIIAEATKRGGAHSMNNALIAYGLACAIRDYGAKEVRRAISKNWNKNHGERLTKKLKAAAVLTRGLPYSNSIAFVDKGLEQYALITPHTLEYEV